MSVNSFSKDSWLFEYLNQCDTEQRILVIVVLVMWNSAAVLEYFNQSDREQ